MTTPSSTLEPTSVRELAGLCADRSWDTDDALGIGGLLCDAHRLVQLTSAGTLNEPGLLGDLLRSSLSGLETLAGRGAFSGRRQEIVSGSAS